jgi:hypothetical protein
MLAPAPAVGPAPITPAPVSIAVRATGTTVIFLTSPCHVPFVFVFVRFTADGAGTGGTEKLNGAVAITRFSVTLFAVGAEEVIGKETGRSYGIGT